DRAVGIAGARRRAVNAGVLAEPALLVVGTAPVAGAEVVVAGRHAAAVAAQMERLRAVHRIPVELVARAGARTTREDRPRGVVRTEDREVGRGGRRRGGAREGRRGGQRRAAGLRGGIHDLPLQDGVAGLASARARAERDAVTVAAGHVEDEAAI